MAESQEPCTRAKKSEIITEKAVLDLGVEASREEVWFQLSNTALQLPDERGLIALAYSLAQSLLLMFCFGLVLCPSRFLAPLGQQIGMLCTEGKNGETGVQEMLGNVKRKCNERQLLQRIQNTLCCNQFMMVMWRGARNAKKVAQTRYGVGCVVTLQSVLSRIDDAYFVILAPQFSDYSIN